MAMVDFCITFINNKTVCGDIVSVGFEPVAAKKVKKAKKTKKETVETPMPVKEKKKKRKKSEQC